MVWCGAVLSVQVSDTEGWRSQSRGGRAVAMGHGWGNVNVEVAANDGGFSGFSLLFYGTTLECL